MEARADALAEFAAFPDFVPSPAIEAQPMADAAAPAEDGRPGNRLQAIEIMDSAPGLIPIPDLAPSLTEDAWLASEIAARSALPDATLRAAPRLESGDDRLTLPAGGGRPENWPQAIENMDSAPGNGWRTGAAFGTGGAFVSRAFPNPPCPEFLRVRAKPKGLAA